MDQTTKAPVLGLGGLPIRPKFFSKHNQKALPYGGNPGLKCHSRKMKNKDDVVFPDQQSLKRIRKMTGGNRLKSKFTKITFFS